MTPPHAQMLTTCQLRTYGAAAAAGDVATSSKIAISQEHMPMTDLATVDRAAKVVALLDAEVHFKITPADRVALGAVIEMAYCYLGSQTARPATLNPQPSTPEKETRQ